MKIQDTMSRISEGSHSTKGCPECSGDIIYSNSERLCEDCGLVVDEGPPQDASSCTNDPTTPTDPTLTEQGLTTYIEWHGRHYQETKQLQSYESLGKRLQQWQARIRENTTKERSLSTALNEINRIASTLGLPDVTRETASVIYRRAFDEDLIIGWSIETIATAATYLACRQEDVPRSLDDFVAVARISRVKIGRGYRHLAAKLDLELPPTDPRDYLPRFCSELSVDIEIERTAREIINTARDEDLLSGCFPTGVAGAAIYVAAKDTDRTVTQNDVAEVADVAVNTICSRSQDLQGVLE